MESAPALAAFSLSRTLSFPVNHTPLYICTFCLIKIVVVFQNLTSLVCVFLCPRLMILSSKSKFRANCLIGDDLAGGKGISTILEPHLPTRVAAALPHTFKCMCAAFHFKRPALCMFRHFCHCLPLGIHVGLVFSLVCYFWT